MNPEQLDKGQRAFRRAKFKPEILERARLSRDEQWAAHLRRMDELMV